MCSIMNLMMKMKCMQCNPRMLSDYHLHSWGKYSFHPQYGDGTSGMVLCTDLRGWLGCDDELEEDPLPLHDPERTEFSKHLVFR